MSPHRGRPQRARRERPPVDVFHVFGEGRETERRYLDHLGRQYRDRVSLVIDDRVGVPATLVDWAIEQKRKDRRRAAQGGAQPVAYWCVFDRDEHPDVKQTLERAAEAGINVAFTNPCIELWFLLHDKRQTAWIDGNDARRECERRLGFSKKPTREQLDSLFAHVDLALDRAIQLEKDHRLNGSWPMENPSSTLWTLIEAIRSAGSDR